MKTTKVTADAVIIQSGKILLIKRAIPPFKGKWALPGGHIGYNEKTENAVVREVKEETGLAVKIIKLVGVYSDPKRDPRGHTVTAAYLCEPAAANRKSRAGDDASEAWWWPLDDLPDLAFDHSAIIKDAQSAIRVYRFNTYVPF